ncbi:MAG: hypothetical protein JSR76_05345 [Verrucomicrobia bacterium]|nr:hypothetical protein [Verrucomicrobiota bacterium]
MIKSLFYNAVILFWALCLLPREIYRLIFLKKPLKDFLQRLGISLPAFPWKKKGEMRIWIHAVSLGETKAIGPLIAEIRKDYPKASLFFSSTTETGHDEAKRSYKEGAYFFFLPLDLSFVMKRLITRISPDLFILVETDFWWHLLSYAKKNDVNVVLINGKISLASLRNYKRAPRFAKELFSLIDLYCVQSEEYFSSFKSLGVREERIFVTGNVKFDMKEMLSQTLYFKTPHENKKVVTLASTHEEEEAMILEVLEGLKGSVSFLIAPRHPSRFPVVAKLLKKKGISFRHITEEGTGAEDVVLVDKVGVLDQCYRYSQAVIVGGSFVKHVGGHNIYEPVRFGVPVLYGPYMHKQEQLVTSLKKHNIGEQVELSALKGALERLLETPEEQLKYQALRSEMEGATERSWSQIKSKILSQPL